MPPLPPPIVVDVDVWAADLIVVDFSQPMANNAALANPANYVITPDGSEPGVQVYEVRTGNIPNPSRVFLVVSPFLVGVRYTVSVGPAVVNAEGTTLLVPENAAKFIGRRTKIDSAIGHRPSMYDVSADSIDRNIMNAIMREDDILGGSRNDRIPNNISPSAAAATGVVISPPSASVPAGAKQQFRAIVFNEANQAVTWKVNGVIGGDGVHGTIDVNGLYTAPLVVPGPPTVTVSATSVAIPADVGTAPVTVIAAVVDHINVAPFNPSFATGNKQTFTATAVFTDGSTLGVSTDGNTVWRSFRPDLADFGLALLAVNGGFESGDFTGWTHATTGAQQLTIEQLFNDTFVTPHRLTPPHGGLFQARIGRFDGAGNGNATLTQQIVVPATGTTTLTFWGNFHTLDIVANDQQIAQIRDAADVAVLTTIFSQASNTRAWTKFTVDLTPYAGTTITLHFASHDDAGAGDPTYWFLDDVQVVNTLAKNVLQSFSPGLTDEVGGTPVSFAIEATYLGVAGSVVVTLT